MHRRIDLSHKIEKNMPCYPGDETVILDQVKTFDKDGYNMVHVKAGMHLGTHVDAPLHLMGEGHTVADIPLYRFMGKGCFIDVRGQTCIKYDKKYEALINKEDIVVLYTGYSDVYGTAEYYESHPVIETDFAELLIRKQVKMVGFDMPSPDRMPFEIHKILFEENILLLENLTNLEKLIGIKVFEIYAVPLKIDAEASLVRAFAVI